MDQQKRVLFLPPLDLHHVARSTLQSLIRESTTDPKLLDQIARLYFKDIELMKDLIPHPLMPPDTLVFLHESGFPEIQRELESRLDYLPATLEAYKKQSQSKQGAPHPARKAEAETDGTLSQRIRRMTVSEKIKFAMNADKMARSLLIMDSNKMVALAVLECPKLTEQEVESIARSRNISEEVLRTISKKREWLKNYTILHSLVNNPKTPVGISITLLPNLKTKDLGLLLKNRGVPEPVRVLANKYLKTRART
jgi:hypothetical protein